MLSTQGYAAVTAKAALQPFVFERRDVGPHDVLIAITYCGICHSDIHQARDEWGDSIFPMVPGHEIVGTITAVGNEVKQFHVGETAGVGCFVDSCRSCHACREGLEQYCEAGMLLTYSGRDKDGRPTQGGYSTQIVVDENYVLRVPPVLSPAGAAPLLCAGITTYSPLRHWGVGKYHKLAPEAVDASKGVVMDLQPGDLAIFSGFTPHRSGPNKSAQWRRLLYLSYNAASEGGEQRDAHYAEFHGWLKERYADYGKVNTFFR